MTDKDRAQAIGVYTSDHVAFVGNCPFDFWEEPGKYPGLTIPEMPPNTTYVSQHDLKERADALRKNIPVQSSVWQGTPGFMSPSWVNKYSRKTSTYRFNTGSYAGTEYLYLVDDVIQWAHRRLERKEIRTCADIIWQLAGRKGRAEPTWSWYKPVNRSST